MSTSNRAGYSNFTYWVPAPPPPSPGSSAGSDLLGSTDSAQPQPIDVGAFVLALFVTCASLLLLYITSLAWPHNTSC